MSTFNRALKRAAQDAGNFLCFGFDPVLERIPLSGGKPKERILRFFSMILDELEASGIRPASVKPNSAFFEQYGIGGFEALFEIVQNLQHSGIQVILDAKRSDIGKTAAAYARFVFDELKADAVTVNPYLGLDSMEPFLDYCNRGKGVYILLKTSNPGSRDFQELMVSGRPLYLHVLDKIMENKVEGLGAVVGGTHPNVLNEVLKISKERGRELPLLIPGIGSQGAPAEDLKEILFQNEADMHRINASSSLLYAWETYPGGKNVFAKAARSEFQKLIAQFSR